ncbi:MAG TPA: peptidyl-prolyl cis-trans isomerase [Sedimentisphaerales bacterium]|nr:peptidyl-prolyl cis-trans isomerase [Sedimentisphaerales bacterium]HRS10389.1 peptidyl-prolyl cis-trans isomerase [Sedimentisphaerales bacterium]HRV47094.1 peptidyl-prolyl cis-trans isomerase [Sedimentisphaerales bacterium]
MAEKLDFSLPAKRPQSSIAGTLTVLLLVTLTALAVANLATTLRNKQPPAGQTPQGLSADQVKALATRLDQRGLHQEAAGLWRDYAATPALTEAERARALFHAGVSLEKAGQFAQAIEQYYRSETTAALDELRTQINTHVKQCFESLGNFAALRYELMDRTSLNPSDPAGGKVVAEIGPEKITEAQLDAIVQRGIENQLASVKAFMPPEQLNEQKKRLLEQYRAPQAKQQFLQGWLAQEILYRQALDEGLADKPETKQVLADVTRSVLSQQLMDEKLASKVNLTETDLQTYYSANKGKYVEPAKARISHIRVADEDRAADVLRRIGNGEDFVALAKEFSTDDATKGDGGAIADDILEGAYVPGIGDANEINRAIFAAAAPAVLTQAFQTDKGWEIVKVHEKHPERQKPFEEVRQQVMQELLRRKQQEVQQDYIKEMMDKYNVIIHTSVLAPAPPTDSQEPPTQK